MGKTRKKKEVFMLSQGPNVPYISIILINKKNKYSIIILNLINSLNSILSKY